MCVYRGVLDDRHLRAAVRMALGAHGLTVAAAPYKSGRGTMGVRDVVARSGVPRAFTRFFRAGRVSEHCRARPVPMEPPSVHGGFWLPTSTSPASSRARRD